MSEELVLRFNGNDYIEYVIKERFKRDYLLKGLLDDNKEENSRDQRVVEIKFKTQEDGVLISVVEKIGFSMLKVGMNTFIQRLHTYILLHIFEVCNSLFLLSNTDKRQKACVHFQRYTVRTRVRVPSGLSCG